MLFCNYLPLEKGRALHLNKLESPLTNDALCQVWLKLAQWFWRRKFFKFSQCILAILTGPFFWTNLNPLYTRMLCAKFGWKPVVLGKKMKMWKVYDNDNHDGQGQILIRKAYLSLQLRWAKNRKNEPWMNYLNNPYIEY